MAADNYLAARQELLAGVFEPADCRPVIAPTSGVDSEQTWGLAVILSLERYPALASIFRPLADGEEHETVGKHKWMPLAPPPDLYGLENPILIRLDLDLVKPARARVPILFKLVTAKDYDNLMALATTGQLHLRLTDAPPELEDETLVIAVTWSELAPRLEALKRSGLLLSD